MVFIRTIVFACIIFSFSIERVNSQTPKKKIASKSTVYSEEHALECLEDYYEFYNADESYSNPKIRRISNNVFYISVKYCNGGKEVCYTKENIGTWDTPIYVEKKNDFFWNSKVLVLTCTSKTKYTIKVKSII